MPFGLCNALATFQRCMTSIFHELIEDGMEVFMDDFSVFGSSFDHCLKNLEKMFKRCEETNLMLNWEKCHFMVKEGIFLVHKVSGTGIEVDKAKIKAISKLPYPMNVKAIRSFLGYAGFYKRFIKDFSQVARSMTQLMVKDAPFNFFEECIQAFDNDYAVREVLGQRMDKHFKPIHYDNITINEAQENYTTKKELLAVVFAFDQFCQYLVFSKTIVFTDHSTLCVLTESYEGASPEIRQHKSFGNVTADHLEDIMTNGQIENTNWAIKRILEKTIRNNRKYLSYKLDDALWAFQTAFKTPLGTTLFRIIYGKACHLPINELDEMRLDAYELSISYKERTKRWHDKWIKAPTNYEKGDKVLLFNSHLRLFPGKLKSRWYGLFSVSKDMKNDVIELYDEDGNEFIVNKQQVKLYQKNVLDTNRDNDITLDDEGEVT
ncbi:reverse transcriptase domain-containing protein [Tanacetum coccineum]